ncbi:MAG: hypothetical protein SFV23_22950 [Planctomycetaceae bacterium]|nr:hypothetical protein [Planctomycetaceae bacterium]
MVKSVRFLWCDPELPPNVAESLRDFRGDAAAFDCDDHPAIPGGERRVRCRTPSQSSRRRGLAAAAELDPPPVRHRPRG